MNRRYTSKDPTRTSPRSEPGYRVPEYDQISSAEQSREGSIQIIDSHTRVYSVPSSDEGIESNDDDDESIEIASSIQADPDENSAITTPDHHAVEKEQKRSEVEAENVSNKEVPRGLNLSGPSVTEVLANVATKGNSQQNPIDIEVNPVQVTGIADTESEDEGPEILPIPQEPSKPVNTNSLHSTQSAPQQRQSLVVADNEVDQDTEDEVKRIILETQARVSRENEYAGLQSPDWLDHSTAGATDGFDSVEEDDFEHDHDWPDVVEANTGPVQFDKHADWKHHIKAHPIGPTVPRTSLFELDEEKDRVPGTAYDSVVPTAGFWQPLQAAEPVDVSRPYEEPLPTSMRRAPSPSDAALARNPSDPRWSLDRNNVDSSGHLPTPVNLSTTTYTPQTYSCGSSVTPRNPFPCRPRFDLVPYPALESPETHSRPYDQGPFISQHNFTECQIRSPSPSPPPRLPTLAWRQYGLESFCGTSKHTAPQKTNEIQSSKINISSLVNTHHTEKSRSLKRKAEDMSSRAEKIESASAPTQDALSHVDDAITHVRDTLSNVLPPLESVPSDDQDNTLPDAQPREHLTATESASFSQDSVMKPASCPVSISPVLKAVDTEGPARKKARTASPTSGGIGKFVSGVCVGLVGAIAAFVATIPSSVRDEALQELINTA